MIRVGDILINPDDVSSVHKETKNSGNGYTIQIIYKSGVVKNFSMGEIGMSYLNFIDALTKEQQKSQDDYVFKLMAAIKSLNNG